jgi:hypothetical protein
MNVLVNDESLKNIADAIRAKKNSTEKYMPGQMGPAIETINVGKKSFTVIQVENEEINITATSSLSQNGNAYTLALPKIIVNVQGNSNYTPGSITVNGVDQGSDKVILEVTDGMVISATAATEQTETTLTFNSLDTRLSPIGPTGNYAFESQIIRDTTNTYDLSSLMLVYSANSLALQTVAFASVFSAQTSTKVTISQGANTYSGAVQYHAAGYSQVESNPCLTEANSNFDPTQPFNLVIELTGTLQ